MFESLNDRLDKAFHVLSGRAKITEINIAESIKEIRRALVEADVSYKIAKDFTEKVKQKALGENVLTSLKPGQLMTKIVRDEMAELMGGKASELELTSSPAVILMAGLQGSGKTTHSAKLANFLKRKKTKKPLLVACDVYRPAAIEQLKVLGEQLKIDVYSNPESNNPVAIAQEALAHAKQNGHNVVIVDTAGRLAIDEHLLFRFIRGILH